jgi:iron complex transport system substrate-binding protein
LNTRSQQLSGFAVLIVTPADHTPQRVVSLQPSATVILSAIGKLDRLVACTRYCAEVCPEAAAGNRAVLADSWTANAEQIVAAHPDLVIAAVPYQEKAVAEILKAGSRFLGLSPRALQDIYTDISTIAGIMGVADRGNLVIAGMQEEIDKVRVQAGDDRRPLVFCEEWGKPLIASQGWVAELVDVAGGRFLGQPGKQHSPAEVAASNPEVLVAAWCGAGDRVPLEKIVRQRGWETISAVRNGRVYCVRDEFLNTPAPTLVHGLHALASAIHPERFPQGPGLRCLTHAINETDARHAG